MALAKTWEALWAACLAAGVVKADYDFLDDWLNEKIMIFAILNGIDKADLIAIYKDRNAKLEEALAERVWIKQAGYA